MSALAGSFAPAGAPIERDVLAAVSRGLRRMGPDGEHEAGLPGLAMVLRPFHTDAASRREPGPVESDGYLLAFDGRVDNAAELRGWLGAGTELDGAALVLAAYRRGGTAAFGRVVGDFALALWDPRDQALVLACDSLGRRPLYYHRTPRHLYWASECRPLLNAAGALPLDEEYVADYMVNRLSPGRSPFRGIHALPAAHALVAPRGAEPRLVRYWSFDPNRSVERATDAEYAEEFAALLREAVACRLRTDGSVACELSGGLDSSSIACMAEGLFRDGRAEAAGLYTVSHIYRSSASSDETRYVRVVEAALGRAGEHVFDDEHPLLAPLPAGLRPDLPTGRLASAAAEAHVERFLSRVGARVLLCGIGGDQLFWAQPFAGLPLADHVVRREPVKLFRAASEWARWWGTALPQVLWAGAVEPFLPPSWQRLTRSEEPMGEWIAPAFARRTGLRERMFDGTGGLRFRLPSRARQYGLIAPSLRTFALERTTSPGYVDVRYPYFDRRLVEFALSIPLEQMVRPGETRSVVRRGLAGVVPDEVRTRVSKAGPSEALQRALVREWPRLSGWLADPLVAAHGWVDGAVFRDTLNRARHGMITHAGQLRKTLSLELWLRTLQPGETAEAPAALTAA